MPKEEMNLVKYCKDSYVDDAVEKGRIFVGTFYRYRRIENDALTDVEEGPAIPAVLDEKNEVVLSEDDNENMLAHSSIKLANGWKLKLPKGMPLWLEQPNFNTFVFCVSQDDEPSIEKANRLGHESFYKITDPFNFGRAVMWSLMKHINSKFGVAGYMGPVNYISRKIQVINEKNPSQPAKSFSTIDFYTKHEKFKKDKEVRYVFLEYSNTEKTEFNSFNTDGFVIENKEICKWIARA